MPPNAHYTRPLPALATDYAPGAAMESSRVGAAARAGVARAGFVEGRATAVTRRRRQAVRIERGGRG